MLEIAPAFRRIERPNVRSDTSVQSFDRSLGSLAQGSLQGMEHQLDGVKVGRILRKESEACANTAESLLYTSDLVERHIIGHHNVSTQRRIGGMRHSRRLFGRFWRTSGYLIVPTSLDVKTYNLAAFLWFKNE